MTSKVDATEGRRPVTRYLDAYLASSIGVGEDATLRVGLTPKPSGRGALEVTVSPQTRLRIELSLSGARAEFVSGTSERLYVPVQGEATPVYFHLRAEEPGQLVARVTCWHGQLALGVTYLESQVLDMASAAPEPENIFSQKVFVSQTAARPLDTQIAFGQTPPDITLNILDEPSGYRFVVYTAQADLAPSSEVSSEAWTVHFARTGQEIMEAIWRQVREGSAGRLDRLGYALYEEMFPPGFKEWYRQQIHPIASQRRLTLALICSEALKPWEIARPFWTEPDGTEVRADFLCRQFVMSRWLPDTLSPPDAVPVNRITIVVRPTKSTAEYDEKRYLLRLQEQLRGLEVDVAYDSFQVTERLAQGDASVLHFLTPPRELYEENAQQLAGFLHTRPLVFVNAHTHGAERLQLTGLGDWAQRFILAGCSAFVGPLWEVDDGLAFEFAVAFYEALWAGLPLAEALDRARERVRAIAPSDPAWLAYTLYGHPFAKVYVPQPGEGYVIARICDVPPGASLQVGKAYELEVTVRPEAPGSYRGQLTDTRQRSSQAPALVQVEVAPGQFVKCRPGEEEEVKAKFRERQEQSRACRR